jgi:hypothetical protein
MYIMPVAATMAPAKPTAHGSLFFDCRERTTVVTVEE